MNFNVIRLKNVQDKAKEKDFFNAFSAAGEYDVFTPSGYKTLIKEYRKLIRVPGPSGSRVVDLGCGTGAFSRRFKEMRDVGNHFFGLDLSIKSVGLAAKLAPGIHFCAGDIEQCCFKDESFDIVLFSGVLHHFTDFEPCLREGYRILKKGGCALSYDPNIKNPFMWLYRHPSSPFFSPKGKTENERLLSAQQVGSALKRVGFSNVITRGKSGVTFKYVASTAGRFLLPLYNLLDILLGISPLASKYGSFLIGYGEKKRAAPAAQEGSKEPSFGALIGAPGITDANPCQKNQKLTDRGTEEASPQAFKSLFRRRAASPKDTPVLLTRITSTKHGNETIALVVPFSRTHYVVPPIGLGYLGTALRKQGFNDIVVLDGLKENLGIKGLQKRFSQLKPAVVGFQLYSYDFPFVVNSIAMVKELLPGSVVIIGGPHVSATQALALREIPRADFALVGEGEIGLPLLLKRLLRQENIPWAEIPGLIYRQGDQIKVNPRAVIIDLDELGFPAWDLMVPGEYPDSPQGGFYRNFPIAPISTTRGCPYSCTFCGSTVNMGKKLRFRSIPMVLREMRMLYDDYGVREFHIIDDMFNFHRQRVEDFCQGIREQGLEISYTFPNGLRLNHLDLETLQMMKETGAYAFNVGIESGSQRILDRMKKNLSLELIEDKVNLIVKAGLEPCGFFILGFPGETPADIRATLRFAKRLPLKRAHFSNFLPLPGTQATQQLMENKEIDTPAWQDLFYSKVPYAPKGISKRKLKSWQRRAYLSFHFRPAILSKMLSELKSFNHFKLTVKRVWDYLFRR